ncbi:hypothetical protein [Streptomyces sp. NPDC007172]|uniref:hypothetical protein n=1 Tax=Streptomyces sp. NPDC007172 TaxID=3364776 RepID=UPI0036A61B5B
MGTGKDLPSANELSDLLATGTFKSVREVAEAYGVSEGKIRGRILAEPAYDGVGRPPKLPTAGEIFVLLAKKVFENQKEIADYYGVSEAAVSIRLAPFKDPKIDFRSLMPWKVASKHRGGPPGRALRLHLRAKLENHTLTEKHAQQHAAWLADMSKLVVNYDQSEGWSYQERKPEHGNLLIVLPESHELPSETVELYRME